MTSTVEFCSLGQLVRSVSSGTTKSRSSAGRFPLFGSTGQIALTNDATYSGEAILVARVGANAGYIYRVDGRYGVTDNTLIIKVDEGVRTDFLAQYLTHIDLNRQVYGSGQPLITGKIIKELPFPNLSLNAQRQISESLRSADDLIASLEHLIAKKREINQGLMQAMLTGATRLDGFRRPWSARRIHEVLAPRSELNVAGESLEVLSCTKHEGFVRSLDYFKNQVFSRDLSSYRVIRRGDIGYPANHIEEGSIGVQEIYDRAVVSPIYVVMYPLEGNDTFFLQRQMKLESFRQKFARVMNASVDRRGSLRWKEFSQIEVQIPDLDEQHAISRVLRDADDEIAALERRLDSARAIKQGMMQELLTGSTRLAEEVAA